MNSWTNSWAVAGLLGLITLLISLDLLLDLRGQRSVQSSSAGAAPGWTVSCGTGLCAAVDAGGNTYWGVYREGAPPAGGFHWYRAGNLGDAEPFGIAQCRETVRSYASQRADLRDRLAKFPDPERAGTSGGDAVDAAQQRMLARIERMDLQKRLDKLEAEQAGAAAECRKLIEGGR
jgi:hypothetical protein